MPSSELASSNRFMADSLDPDTGFSVVSNRPTAVPALRRLTVVPDLYSRSRFHGCLFEVLLIDL